MKLMSKPVILTGLRANNDLTIGNYFGAMLPIIDMAKKRSDDYQVNMFIPDLHSFTTPVDHSKLQEQILQTAKLFVAAGLPLDNESIYLYRQSYVSAHSELTWILDCFTGIGEMSRMTQFKDKSEGIGDERVSMGLFNYPVLMAADILLYSAQYVPVGDDQSQHLEFTRDIAERMNSRFGEILSVPKSVKEQHEFFGKDQGLRIKDLIDPSKKMSKSDESGRGVIFLGDSPEEAAKKVMGATTDDKAEIHFDRENQPGVSNLLEILALLRGVDRDSVVAEFEGQTRYGDFKAVVAEEVKNFLTNFQNALHNIDEFAVVAKLEQSERDMNAIAGETLLRVQKAVGLRS
jgi:tryptophanyl-tRNA synthetase